VAIQSRARPVITSHTVHVILMSTVLQRWQPDDRHRSDAQCRCSCSRMTEIHQVEEQTAKNAAGHPIQTMDTIGKVNCTFHHYRGTSTLWRDTKIDQSHQRPPRGDTTNKADGESRNERRQLERELEGGGCCETCYTRMGSWFQSTESERSERKDARPAAREQRGKDVARTARRQMT